MTARRLEIPTVKFEREELLRAAREADERARAAEVAALPSTKRPGPSEREFPVEIEVAEDHLDVDALMRESEECVPAPGPTSLESDVRPTWRSKDGPALSSVPCVVASKEDLSWFELEEASEVVLAMIDGASTVGSILDSLAMPREQALTLLRELGSHGVVEFH
jgi:hypothetical protein